MESGSAIVLLFLHGDYGWQGFVFAALVILGLVALFNELAARTLNRKHVKSTIEIHIEEATRLKIEILEDLHPIYRCRIEPCFFQRVAKHFRYIGFVFDD